MFRALWLAPVVVAMAILVACGIGIRRDYTTIPVGQVGFDDLCGLQDYFDTIEAKLAKPPAIVSAVDIEADSDKRIQGGKNRFLFETDFQLANVRRVLDQNWNRLPEALATARQIELEVHWSEKAGVRRVVTDTDAEIVADKTSFAIPYHVCLSELLYGEPLYHQRREMSGRSLPYRSLLGDAGLAPAPAPAGETAPGAPPGPPAPATPETSRSATPPPQGGADAGRPPEPAFAPARAAPAVHDGGPPAPLHLIFKAAPPAQ